MSRDWSEGPAVAEPRCKKKKKKKDNTRGRNTSSFFFFPVGHEEMGYTLAGRKVFACLENFSSLDIVDDEDDG